MESRHDVYEISYTYTKSHETTLDHIPSFSYNIWEGEIVHLAYFQGQKNVQVIPIILQMIYFWNMVIDSKLEFEPTQHQQEAKKKSFELITVHVHYCESQP